jgi:hypothetical protein
MSYDWLLENGSGVAQDSVRAALFYEKGSV